VTFV